MQLDLFTQQIAAAPDAGPPPGRPYQIDVLDRARRQIGAGRRRGVIQGETGSGKSWVIADLARGAVAKEKSVLILADRRRLISQLGWMLDRFKVPYGFIMAGSSRDTEAPIILATRDTLAAWSAVNRAIRSFDTVLVDECHRAMGNVYQQLLAMFPNAVHIGTTATPARGDGRTLGSFYQWIECMVPASQLIAEGWLVKPDVMAPMELASKRRMGKKTEGRAGCPIQHWRKYANGLRTIAFAASVAESLGLRDRFVEAGIAAEHIDGTSEDDIRDGAFTRLARGEILVLCTVGLAIEGLDIPEVAAAILWRKFGSLVMYRQACGRIMRPCPGKDRAVVLDHVGAAGVHGLPGHDIRWSLEAGTSVKDRMKDAPATIYCAECGYAFSGVRTCPSCGWQRPSEKKPRKPVDPTWKARDEMLVPYGGPTSQMLNDELHQRWWKVCVGVTVAKGRKAAAAVAMYQSKFGVPPWQHGVQPLPGRGDWQRPAAEVFPGFVRRKAAKAS